GRRWNSAERERRSGHSVCELGVGLCSRLRFIVRYRQTYIQRMGSRNDVCGGRDRRSHADLAESEKGCFAMKHRNCIVVLLMVSMAVPIFAQLPAAAPSTVG